MKKHYCLVLAVLSTLAIVFGCSHKAPTVAQKYTVTFVANSANVTGEMQEQTFTDGEAQKLAKNQFTRENHIFVGWATSPDGSKEYNDEQSISITSDMTLYAVWGWDIVYVRFDKNAPNATGEMARQSFLDGIPQSLNLNTFEYTNYTFIGWATSPNGEKVYNDGETITITSNITLHAVWKPTVTFNANGGEGEMAPQIFSLGTPQKITKNTFTRDRYCFLGWATSPDGSLEYDDEQSISITSNTTLYAVWEGNLLSISVAQIYTGEYLVGDTIANEEITVTATYKDGSSRTVTTWTTDETFTEPATNKEITISYTENGVTKTTTLTISIVNEYTITYSSTDNATVLDGHHGTAGTSWTYVQFGDWPQTIKAEDVRILERQKLETGLFTYYAGSDGNWYVKQDEKAFSRGDAYKYSDGTTVNQGGTTTRYFKVEPIKWRVLEEKDGKKFLFAENGLMALPYYDTASGTRTIGTETDVHPNNYKHSKIHAWLNGYIYKKETADCADYQNKGFLQTAFTSIAQAKIATTTVDNSLASTLDSENKCVCEDTDDKVFLLSRKEVTTASYGFDRSNGLYALIRKPTDFALATGAMNDRSYGGSWWYRSPSSNSYYACIILDASPTSYHSEVSRGHSMVVPALWLEP